MVLSLWRALLFSRVHFQHDRSLKLLLCKNALFRAMPKLAAATFFKLVSGCCVTIEVHHGIAVIKACFDAGTAAAAVAATSFLLLIAEFHFSQAGPVSERLHC